jgi:hypothetical protein
MGGQPRPELELHGRPWGCSSERGERGNERARGGMAGGHDRGAKIEKLLNLQILGEKNKR